MNSAQLLREIKRTDQSLRHAKRVIAEYTIPEPYCYLLPVLGFCLGFQAQGKVSTTTVLQLIKAQLMLNTLLETQTHTHL